jgi:ATP-binding cassette, subfamily C, bacterial CydD
MKKTRQQQLTRWLKTQSTLAQRWLRLSMLLGLISGMLIVAQAWLLAAPAPRPDYRTGAT